LAGRVLAEQTHLNTKRGRARRSNDKVSEFGGLAHRAPLQCVDISAIKEDIKAVRDVVAPRPPPQDYQKRPRGR
jgi:hypothetical protein